MAVLEKKKGKRLKLLDDTTPLICQIEGINKKEHVDYIMKVQRGANPEDSWQVVHRYSDFVTLHTILEVSGLELPLPPKKVFGNMDVAFISERQQGLQNYMNYILGNPLLARHVSVKKFLDPANYSMDFQEIAMHHVAMFIRSVPHWEIVEPLPDIGWRIQRQYFLIKPTEPTKKDQRSILTWTNYGPDFYLDEKDAEAAFKLLPTIQHPFIFPVAFATAKNEGAIILKNYIPQGSLSDCLCRVKTPKSSQLKKYGSPRQRMIFQVEQIQLFGRQILEALKFLYDKGLPYGHLHTGNLTLEGNVCRLLDVENFLLGIPTIHRNRFVPMRKMQEPEAQDVYGFAHVLYEMACGEQLRGSLLHQAPPQCPIELRPILESILNEDAVNKSGLLTIADLLAIPFFSSALLPPLEKPLFKIPSKLKESIREAREKTAQRLKEDQKYLRQFRRVSKAHAHHMSEEEKKKRKKSAKRMQKQDSTAGSGSAPSSPSPQTKSQQPNSPPSSPAPPRPPQVPAAPPPPAQSTGRSTPPPSNKGRGALLNSISSFSKSGLKKAETNDKSAPKI